MLPYRYTGIVVQYRKTELVLPYTYTVLVADSELILSTNLLSINEFFCLFTAFEFFGGTCLFWC